MIGVMHNKALDYTYNYVKRALSYATEISSEEEKNRIIKEVIKQFAAESFGYFEPAEKEKIEDYIDDIFSKIDSFRISNEKMKDSFSPALKSYANEIDQLLLREGLASVASVQESLRDIEKRASKHLNGIDRSILLSMVSVGRHSLEYWSDSRNYDKWKNLWTLSRPVRYAGFFNMDFLFLSWKEDVPSYTILVKGMSLECPYCIVAADLLGAAAGVRVGIFAGGIIPLPGAAPVLGAALGIVGGAASSICEANKSKNNKNGGARPPAPPIIPKKGMVGEIVDSGSYKFRHPKMMDSIF